MKEDDLNKEQNKKELDKERFKLLRTIDRVLEIPMIILAFIWIVLLVIELLKKSSPILDLLSIIIWLIFIIDFTIKFIIAPSKIKFLKSNLITIASLILPALRVFRLFRFIWVLKLARGIVLARMLGQMNRTIRALSLTMEKRAFGFIAILSLIILLLGAAGMLMFEKNVNPGLQDYGSAVWWTAMIFTTMGSETWPMTAEGRILCLLLALYAITIAGYITATFAKLFFDIDSQEEHPEVASGKQIEDLKKEILELKEMISRNNKRQN